MSEWGDKLLTEADNARLRAENEKLREENERFIIKLNAEQIVRQNVESENAKLRELVKSAWRCIHTGISCSDCRLIAGGCTLQSAMAELGCEVGE